MKRHIDASSARRIAVAADVDPRTVRKVLAGEATRDTMSILRAKKALKDAGYDLPGDDDGEE